MDSPARGQQAEAAPAGTLGSALGLLSTLAEMTYTRLELLILDLQEGVASIIGLVVWSIVAVFAAAFGLFIGALSLIFAFWDTHRILVSLLVMMAFVLLAVLAAWRAIRRLRTQGLLFSTTLLELARDRDFLRQAP